jgi:hypothetical protein
MAPDSHTNERRNMLINSLLVLAGPQTIYEDLPKEVRDVCKLAAEALEQVSEKQQTRNDVIDECLEAFGYSCDASESYYECPQFEDAKDKVRALKDAAPQVSLNPLAGPAESAPAHNDHPLRHWDRTCPACIAESAPTPKEADFGRKFLAAVRELVNGGPYDLTDSPKSLVGNLQRLINELDEAEGRIPERKE